MMVLDVAETSKLYQQLHHLLQGTSLQMPNFFHNHTWVRQTDGTFVKKKVSQMRHVDGMSEEQTTYRRTTGSGQVLCLDVSPTVHLAVTGTCQTSAQS